jgi:hypothetical protein
MHLAYSCGVDRLWIVNVGDIKPMEFPTQFFLDYTWNPDAWPAGRLPEYTQRWAEQQFGPRYSNQIAEILTTYTQYNSRRKPELLSPDTYSLLNYREAETVVVDYRALAQKAQRISNALPANYRDAFYQLVLHPVLACSNLNDLYVTVARNHLYAKQGRASTNGLAERARKLYAEDSLISYHFNHVMSNGKWNHMMDQTHIGYTYWQQPDYNSMPTVSKIELPAACAMGVSIEGSANWWPEEKSEALLPEFDPEGNQPHYLEVFNRGIAPFKYTCRTGVNWIKISPVKGTITAEQRLWVKVDWQHAPAGKRRVPITIDGPNKRQVIVIASINNPPDQTRKDASGFVESDGYVSIEAEHYSKAVGTPFMAPDSGSGTNAVSNYSNACDLRRPNSRRREPARRIPNVP